MTQRPEILAFPAALSERVAAIAVKLAQRELHPPHSGTLRIIVGTETLALPCRVYYTNFPSTQHGDPLNQTIRNCLGSRHHDGHVREQCVRALLHDDREWVVPFVFAMLGDYVIEIIRAIEQDLPAHVLPAWQRFAANNPDYLATTRGRAIRYWDCYHRAAYPKMADYPALSLLKMVPALIEV